MWHQSYFLTRNKPEELGSNDNVSKVYFNNNNFIIFRDLYRRFDPQREEDFLP